MANPTTVVVIPVEGPITSHTIADAEANYEFFSRTVGGFIEATQAFPGHTAIINEEGKLEGLQANERATDLMRGYLIGGDHISGNMILIGNADAQGRTTGVDLEKVQELLSEPIVEGAPA